MCVAWSGQSGGQVSTVRCGLSHNVRVLVISDHKSFKPRRFHLFQVMKSCFVRQEGTQNHLFNIYLCPRDRFTFYAIGVLLVAVICWDSAWLLNVYLTFHGVKPLIRESCTVEHIF